MDPGKAHVETLTETRTKNAKTALLRNDFQFSATLSKHTAVVHTARRVVRQIPIKSRRASLITFFHACDMHIVALIYRTESESEKYDAYLKISYVKH